MMNCEASILARLRGHDDNINKITQSTVCITAFYLLLFDTVTA